MTSTFSDPNAQLSGASYGGQSDTPPSQQQQHMADAELRLQENLQQLREGGDMMHAGNAPQYAQLAQMPPTMNTHQHFQTPTRAAHSPQQMAHAVMSLEGHHDPYDPNDPSRKRSKVSRACDECRRKKIRCDATSENGPEACSSCKRTGARCQFSRQPMKRGPSKGYIKELADRLHSLENRLPDATGSSTNFDFAPMSDQAFANTQSPPQYTRKRTHSVAEDYQEAFSRPSWSGQDRGNCNPSEEDALFLLTEEEHTLNGNRGTSLGDSGLLGSLVTESNDEILKAYASVVHPTMPILPHNLSTLTRLTHCPTKLREAFFLCLEASVRSIAPRALTQTELSLNQLLQQCFTAVDTAKYTLHDADSSIQLYNYLIYCQSMILLAVASDRPGPATVGSIAQLLGQIAGTINEAGINDSKILKTLREQDQEVFFTARRVFWTAFILDRFHASSRSRDVMFPLESGLLSREDTLALGGDVGYHLTRAANILGQIAIVTRAAEVANLAPSSPFADLVPNATSPQTIYLNGQLNGFRESIEYTTLTNNSPPYLAYQYLRLFVGRLPTQPTQSGQLLTLTKDLLRNLISGTITPLHHIFASLVATSLSELSDRLETQVEAHASIKDMSDALSNGQILHPSSDGLGWDTAIRDLLHQKKASTPPPQNHREPRSPGSQPNTAGLQHLAAAAVGEREGVDARPPSSDTIAKVDHDLSAAVAAANEAAKAQATAAAAQQLSTSPQRNNDTSNFDSRGLTKDWS